MQPNNQKLYKVGGFMTSEQRRKWYADSLRDKYNQILQQKGSLSDEDYENMVNDAEKCTQKDESCRKVILDVMEEFDTKQKGENRAQSTAKN